MLFCAVERHCEPGTPGKNAGDGLPLVLGVAPVQFHPCAEALPAAEAWCAAEGGIAEDGLSGDNPGEFAHPGFDKGVC